MEDRQKTVVALGMFDGVHMGHRELLRRTADAGVQRGAVAAVYTFSNHPAEVLGGCVKLLSLPEERYALLTALAEEVRMEPFTRALCALSPAEFVEKLLSIWDVAGLVVGYNYTFGRGGAGKPETLRALGAEKGFFVEVVPPVLYGGEAVSSTRIRTALEGGDAEGAARMLTRPYALCGVVAANRRIGRRIGFPTANITPDGKRVLPENGVYATAVTVDGQTYPAVTNVGTNPTVGGKALSVESHLLDYEGDLYGRWMEVAFLRRVRGERAFSSVEALKEQIQRDVETARRFHDRTRCPNTIPQDML